MYIQGGEMKTKYLTILLAVTVVVVSMVGAAGAARPIPPSNETSELYVEISATATGTLKSSTDLEFTQGNGNLNDNPPLEAGEGEATIVYTQDTVATSGSIVYDHNIYLDTDGKTAPLNNLETTRSIDYTNDGDGDEVGRMYSSETVVVTESASGSTTDGSCCPWGVTESDVVPGTCVEVEAGSEVDLKEGSVDSESTARTVSDSVGEDVEMTYSVDVEGSGQTGNDAAEGHASVYVDVEIREGAGDGANQTTDADIEQDVSVDGLVTLAMRTGWSSGE